MNYVASDNDRLIRAKHDADLHPIVIGIIDELLRSDAVSIDYIIQALQCMVDSDRRPLLDASIHCTEAQLAKLRASLSTNCDEVVHAECATLHDMVQGEGWSCPLRRAGPER